eukprot:6207757-Pleurochrysis_carterae.AAC.4
METSRVGAEPGAGGVEKGRGNREKSCYSYGRSHPYSAHMLNKATKFAQSRRACGVRKRALEAVHRSESF